MRRGRNSAAEEFGYRVFGVGAGAMAGFDPRDGPLAVRGQYRLPAPNLARQSKLGPFFASLTLARFIRL